MKSFIEEFEFIFIKNKSKAFEELFIIFDISIMNIKSFCLYGDNIVVILKIIVMVVLAKLVDVIIVFFELGLMVVNFIMIFVFR